jgi:hypothetical protein
MLMKEPKPRPKLKTVRTEMERLKADLETIIVDKEDKEGRLSEAQLDRARQTKDALEVALRDIDCVQVLAPY